MMQIETFPEILRVWSRTYRTEQLQLTYILLIHYLTMVRNYLELAGNDGRRVFGPASKFMRWAIAQKVIPTTPRADFLSYPPSLLYFLTHVLTWVAIDRNCGCEMEFYILAINPLANIPYHVTTQCMWNYRKRTIWKRLFIFVPPSSAYCSHTLFPITYVHNSPMVCSSSTRCNG